MNEEGASSLDVDHRLPVQNFLEKWGQRWPEWTTAEVFIPPDQRERARAWFLLLQELADAAWGGQDAAPGLAKLAWWQQELHGWSKGARRHPLGQVLQPQPVAWDALADTLGVLRERDLVAQDIDAASTRLSAFADAVSRAEDVLFGAPRAEPVAVIAPLLADYVAGDDVRRKRLLEHWSRQPSGSRARRILSELARARLQQMRTGEASPLRISRWGVLWRSWNAARN